jgi:glucan phosphoethanolaminetransferase (alkaline phosphatase superfamily)
MANDTVSKNNRIVNFIGSQVQRAYVYGLASPNIGVLQEIDSCMHTNERWNLMAAFKKVFSNHSFFSAVMFVVLLYLLEEYLFDVPQVKFVLDVMRFASGRNMCLLFASSIASFLVGCFFVQAALGSSRTFQVVYIFLFTLSLVVQYGFWRAVQRFMIPADLKIAAATPIEMWKGAGVLFFDWRFIVPVIVFVLWLFMFGKRQGLKISFTKFGSLLLFVVVLSFFYSSSYTAFDLGSSFSSFYQTIARFIIENALPTEREAIGWSHAQAPKNNIVLVIDESIRPDHLSINGYERETTPFLDRFAKTEDGFHNIGVAVSGGTCSYASNALLLTGVCPGSDDFQKTASYPTVFQYAKAMGYQTFYLDVQTNSLWNGLTDRDLPFIDSWFKARDFGYDFDGDFRAADLIVEIVSERSGNFIVLNKRGVHFLYENSYPQEGAVWPPPPRKYVADPVLVLNPYDNGIIYNVNTFFERLLANPQILENATIIYTSDHGQTLFENHVTWPHCNDTPQEATVPLILIGRHLPSIDPSWHASHSNILPTILDLMGVPSEERLHLYAPSLFSEAEHSTDYFYFGAGRLIDFSDP